MRKKITFQFVRAMHMSQTFAYTFVYDILYNEKNYGSFLRTIMDIGEYHYLSKSPFVPNRTIYARKHCELRRIFSYEYLIRDWSRL